MNKLSIPFLVLLFSASFMCLAQAPAPSYPDNILTNADPIGLPPQASTEGTSELVNLSSGSLNMFIPVVSLPQRGGANPLILGFTYDSNQTTLQQNLSASATTDPNNDTDDYYIYSEQTASSNPFNSPLQVNLPILKASFEYEGDGYVYPAMIDANAAFPVFCLTNFSFTDWSGATHQFQYATSNCNQAFISNQLSTQPVSPVLIDESTDLAHYRLDITQHEPSANADPLTNITVTAPDGTVYSWPNLVIPQAQIGDSMLSNNQEQFLNIPPSTVVDPNGNAITITAQEASETPGGIYTILDTVGRQIIVNSGSAGESSSPNPSISYKDSSGTQQNATLTQIGSQVTDSPDAGSDIYSGASCGISAPQVPSSNPTYTLYNASSSPSTGILSTYELTFSGTGKTYTMQLDGYGHLLKIQYPFGGYTRYDYQLNPFLRVSGPITCSWGLVEVYHKYECSSSSGNCSSSQEVTTTYSPFPESGSNPCPSSEIYSGIYFANQYMSMIDPEGTSTTHCFTASTGLFGSPIETDTFVVDSSNLPLRHTTIIPNIQGWPIKTTTIVQDVQPNLSYMTSYSYDSHIDIPVSQTQNIPMAGSLPIQNPLEIDQYGFNGALIKKTTQTWTYDGNILNRLHSRSIYDAVSGKTATTTIDYNDNGNPVDKIVGGSDAGPFTSYYQNLDVYGRPTQIKDARNNVTVLSYSDSWQDASCAPSTNSSAYLTSSTNALNQITSYKYNSCTGTLASVTDPNQQTTSYQYDSLGRVTDVSFPGGGHTHVAFVDSAPNSETTTVTATPDPSIVSSSVLDGFGRPSIDTEANGATTETTYDAVGRVASVTNPHLVTPSSTDGTTSFAYDALGRKLYQCQPDNGTGSGPCVPTSSFLKWTYTGNITTLTDEVGNQWQQTVDALGRLTQVLELGTAASPLNLETDYSYDGLDNLLLVTQLGTSSESPRVRSFTYDSLSRLVCASNPESSTAACPTTATGSYTTGTTGYTYDANGNLLSKIALQSNASPGSTQTVTTNYSYDALNRLLSKTYLNDPSGTLSSCFQYDTTPGGIGRLAVEWTQAGVCPASAPASGAQTMKKILAYDSMGRVLKEQQCHLNNCTTTTPPYNIQESYDLAGNQTSYTNGIHSIVLTSTYDAAGRLNAITSSLFDYQHPATLFSVGANGYSPANAIQNMMLGTELNVIRTYDDRLRPTSETATHP